MKAWIHLQDDIVKGALLETIPHEYLAAELGEWLLSGLQPILHDFEEEPVAVNRPLPEQRQGALFEARDGRS